jgi:uncharacterized Zn finger protein
MSLTVSSRENAEAKGRRYLTEGRLTLERVDASGVRATCRGGGVIYDVAWAPGDGWSCSCPARGRCAHRVALELVVVRGES